MEEQEREDDCIPAYPVFNDVGLNRRVLHTASIGLKTKKSYHIIRHQDFHSDEASNGSES